MIVNEAALTALYTEFRALFEASMQGAVVPFDFSRFTMFVPTKTITVNYAWLGDLKPMRRWVGDRVAHTVKASNYSVDNVPYEDTLEIFIRDMEADNLGIYRPKVQLLAQEAKRHPLRLFAAVLENNDLCFDGQNLIDTDHPKDDGTTWSNKGTSALDATTFESAYTAGAEITDMNGDPIGVMYDTLMVPPRLRSAALKIVASERMPGGSNNDVNPNYQIVDVVVNPYLKDTNNWYLIDSKLPVKPVIHQERKAVQYAEDNTDAFRKGVVYHGIDGDYAFAPGLPYGIFGAIVP